MGKSIDAMVLSGLALAFSRLIDDSVVVIENVYRHLEMGEEPRVAAVKGANEVALGGPGHHARRGGRVFPGDLSFRREPIPLRRAGAGRRACSLCFLFRCGDRRAPVLRQFPESRSMRPPKARKHRVLGSEVPCRI